jgi:hypothetical protein
MRECASVLSRSGLSIRPLFILSTHCHSASFSAILEGDRRKHVEEDALSMKMYKLAPDGSRLSARKIRPADVTKERG